MEQVLLCSKKMYEQDVQEGEKRIEELKKKLKKKSYTNPVNFHCTDKFQQMRDYQNHAEISIIIGELYALIHEFEGFNGMIRFTTEFSIEHSEWLTERYQEYYNNYLKK